MDEEWTCLGEITVSRWVAFGTHLDGVPQGMSIEFSRRWKMRLETPCSSEWRAPPSFGTHCPDDEEKEPPPPWCAVWRLWGHLGRTYRR